VQHSGDPDDAAFTAEWNALERGDRLRVRRLARLGRAIDDERLRALAGAYARLQIARPWMRYFWWWFVPGLLISIGAASRIHPLVVGVVLALAAQAVWAHISLKRLARQPA
jgi:hypothetical protein